MDDKFILIPKEELVETLGALLDEKLEDHFHPFNSVIAVKQKEACEALGISDDTVRHRISQGRITPLQRDGSRLVILTFKMMRGLKPRTRRPRLKG